MKILRFVMPAHSVLHWMGKRVMPRQYWRFRFRLMGMMMLEPELRLVPYLCDAKKRSIDIGASTGIYTVHMLKASRDVVAFEPRPSQAAELSEMFESLGAPVRVESVALSNRAGISQMRMLMKDLGRSTIETANLLEDEDGSPEAQISVEVRRLDDFGLDEIGFIKIDVEGHELAVLEGARDTIVKNSPIILVESENRHRKNAVADIAAFFRQLGYTGLYLLDGNMCSLDTFDEASHQNARNIGSWKQGWERRGTYVNNFLFVPTGQDAVLTEAVEKIKASNASPRYAKLQHRSKSV